MRKTTKGILGIISGVTLAIGTAAAAPPNLPDTNSPKATETNKLPGAKVTTKEGAKPGKPVAGSTDRSVKAKGGVTASKPTSISGERSVKAKEGAKSGNNMELTRR